LAATNAFNFFKQNIVYLNKYNLFTKYNCCNIFSSLWNFSSYSLCSCSLVAPLISYIQPFLQQPFFSPYHPLFFLTTIKSPHVFNIRHIDSSKYSSSFFFYFFFTSNNLHPSVLLMSYSMTYNWWVVNDMYWWVITWHSCIHDRVYLKMLYLNMSWIKSVT